MARMLIAALLLLALPASAHARGTFGPADVIHQGDDHTAVVAGRLKGGPALDLAAVAPNRGRIDFAEQTTPGTFTPAGAIDAGQNARSIGAGDFDQDGDDDLATGGNGAVVVWTNDGGTFTRGTSYAVGGDPAEIVVAQLDNDGDPEIVAATGAPQLSVLRGQAGIGFARNDYATSGWNALHVATGDFDADGLGDIALGTGAQSFGSGRVEIYKGSPLNNFTRTHAYDFPSAGYADPQWLAVADLEGDGDQDLIAGNPPSHDVLEYRGTAGDDFAAPVRLRQFGPELTGLTAGDFDGDGRGEWAASLKDHTIAVGAAIYPAGPNVQVEQLATRDLDGDGAPDLFTANRADGISVLRNEVAANLSIELSAPAGAQAGTDVTYTLKAANLGPDTAHEVVATLDGEPLSLGTLAGGASVTRTIVRTARATSTATVGGRELDPVPQNNTATATIAISGSESADLELAQTDTPDPVAPGGLVTYHVTVTNHGPTLARDVTITDRFPGDYVNAVPSAGGSCAMVSATVTCTFAGVPANGAATVALSVRAAGTSLSNQASATSATPDPGPSANASTEKTAIGEQGGSGDDPVAAIGDVTLTEATATRPPP